MIKGFAYATLAAALLPALAWSQTSGPSSTTTTTPMASSTGTMTATETRSRSFIPYTSFGYVGVNGGQSSFQSNCVSGFNCDENGVGFKVYTGGLLYKAIGVELAYINMGKAERGGGSQKAQGANLSLVGNIPIGDWFSLFGKIGGTYGWTRSDAAAGTGINTGKDNGFGLSYGAGVAFDVTKSLQIVGEWERHRFQFVSGRDEVSLVSAGLKLKF